MLKKSKKKITVLLPNVRLLDPHVSSDDKSALSIIFSIYEALVKRSQNEGYIPGLAESWTIEDDARTWKFQLRESVSFHNGDTLTSEDVIASLERIRSPEMGGELGSQGVYQSYLKGAEFKALDNHTLRISMPEPFADFLDLLVKFPIVPKSALAGLPEAPIGSGPYLLNDISDNRIEMKAFQNYWGETPYISKLIWEAEINSHTRMEKLTKGEAGLVSDLKPADIAEIESSRNETYIVTSNSPVTTIFMCNLQSSPCKNPDVRKALNYAVDTSSIIREVKDNYAYPLNGPFTKNHFGYDPSTLPYPHNPEKARALLTKAGFDSCLDLTLDVPTTLPDEAPQLARMMAEQFAKVGINTEVKEYSDRSSYAEMVRAKNVHDACCFDSSPLSTYRVLREKFHSGSHGPWWQGYQNSKVDSLIDKAQMTMNTAKRKTVYQQINRLIFDDAPWIFLYSGVEAWGLNSKLLGWSPNKEGLVTMPPNA